MLSIIRTAHTNKKAVPGITLFKVVKDGELVQHIFILDEIADDFHAITTRLERALDILESMVHPDDSCDYDHHGYCQAHAWFYTDEECPHKRAIELLSECGRNLYKRDGDDLPF